jgi:aspartyl-tRNA(Asn)/glutamyl-tRNA(Gln) amidotransferase subunit C
MPLSREQVEHVARLARLNLTPQEIGKFTLELTVILDYIDQLASVDLHTVESFPAPAITQNVFREDIARPSLSQKAALSNAPQREGDFFVVPRVIG